MQQILSAEPNSQRAIAALLDRIVRSEAASARLFIDVIDVTAQGPALSGPGGLYRARALIGAQAWTDAALALIECDRSRMLRRLAYDDGAWYCRVGSCWPVPDWCDDGVEFCHRALPLAILGAVLASLAGRERRVPVATTSVPRVSRDRSGSIPAVCCDNYA